VAPEAGEVSAFDLAPTAAVVVNAESRVEATNAVARERFSGIAQGRTVLEAFGQHLLAEPVATSLRDGEVRRLSVRVFSDGWGTYRATLVPFGTPGKRKLALYLGDETEAADFQLLRSQFLTNASHELRTPLTGLSAMLETLDDDELEAGTRRRFISRAREEAARLAGLVHDILLLSELEAERNVLDKTRTDLAQIAATVVAETDEPAAVVGILLNIEAGEPVHIQLTPSLTRTLVQNLVENAVRYAGVGSEVIIRVRQDGSDAVLEVIDDGIGIDEAHLPHVFERFYRADPHRSREVGGTGLGLSIVRHVAQRLGGRAEVESRVGRGTTVRVVVPRAE
jgi:two-component system, OmpR family, phosphate regulon sensor histidine kinase PhoR